MGIGKTANEGKAAGGEKLTTHHSPTVDVEKEWI